MKRVDLLHILDFYEEIEALMDTDDGAVFDNKVLDKFLSSRQILQEELNAVEQG